MLYHQTFDPELRNYKQKLRPQLEGMHNISLGPSFWCVYDHHRQQYDYVEPDSEQVLGWPSEYLQWEGLAFFRQCMDERTAEMYQDMLREGFQYIRQTIPQTKRSRYTINLDFKFNRQDGGVIHLLQQFMILSYDRYENLVYTLEKISDITHRPPLISPMLSIYGPDPEYSWIYYPFAKSWEEEPPFTKSEIRVLELLDKALSTAEIAERLHLSEGTVYTHRKRMLKKAKVNSAAKLLRIARQRGLI